MFTLEKLAGILDTIGIEYKEAGHAEFSQSIAGFLPKKHAILGWHFHNVNSLGNRCSTYCNGRNILRIGKLDRIPHNAVIPCYRGFHGSLSWREAYSYCSSDYFGIMQYWGQFHCSRDKFAFSRREPVAFGGLQRTGPGSVNLTIENPSFKLPEYLKCGEIDRRMQGKTTYNGEIIYESNGLG